MLALDHSLPERFTFHVVGLPHAQLTQAYNHCAFTSKTRKFCNMMKSLGHQVFVYASEDCEADCDEHVCCITRQEQLSLIGIRGPADIHLSTFDYSKPYWTLMTGRVEAEIRKRIKPTDFICVVAGHAPLVAAFPGNTVVEFAVGYEGIYAKYRAFESYAWMHAVYGLFRHHQYGSGGNSPNFFDAVIPGCFDISEFPMAEEPGNYYLFLGRVNHSKGVQIALEVCHRMRRRLIVAGRPEIPLPSWVETAGLVGPEQRGQLMAHARATFVPSLYVEPFGGVSAESLLCGTPVITTDWGSFPEINQHGQTGYRCRTLGDFICAAEKIEEGAINRRECRRYAQGKYATSVVRYQYHNYFRQLALLGGEGWNSEMEPMNWEGKLGPC
jgi:glycosyltransferase involved in cell wall biosynthesis